MLIVMFTLAVASIVGGVSAIIKRAKSNTEFSTAVGIGLVGIGFLLAYFALLWWEF